MDRPATEFDIFIGKTVVGIHDAGGHVSFLFNTGEVAEIQGERFSDPPSVEMMRERDSLGYDPSDLAAWREYIFSYEYRSVLGGDYYGKDRLQECISFGIIRDEIASEVRNMIAAWSENKKGWKLARDVAAARALLKSLED